MGRRARAGYSEPGRIRFESRNGNDITGGYPELRPLNRALSSHAAILDGEIVAFDEQGRPSFGRLQQRMHVRGESAVKRLAKEVPVAYIAFDLLWLDGHALFDLPYSERRELLEGPRARRAARGARPTTSPATARRCSRRASRTASRASSRRSSTARTSPGAARRAG